MSALPGSELDLPLFVRNRNFAQGAVLWGAVAGIGVLLNVGSSWRAGEVGVALLVLAALAAVYFAASWLLATFRADFDQVHVGGVFRRRDVEWSEIDRFEIQMPERRTPFMLNFRPWRDQAIIRLRNGERVRVRALQPRHGFTVISYFTVTGQTPADEMVEQLNRFVRTRATFAERAPAPK